MASAIHLGFAHNRALRVRVFKFCNLSNVVFANEQSSTDTMDPKRAKKRSHSGYDEDDDDPSHEDDGSADVVHNQKPLTKRAKKSNGDALFTC